MCKIELYLFKYNSELDGAYTHAYHPNPCYQLVIRRKNSVILLVTADNVTHDLHVRYVSCTQS